MNIARFHIKHVVFALLILSLLFAASGCQKNSRRVDKNEKEAAPITGIFTSAEPSIPDGFQMLPLVEPYVEEDGTITVYSQTKTEEEGEDGFVWRTTAYLMKLSMDGELLESTEFPLPLDVVMTGAITEEAVYLAESSVNSTVVWRIDRTTGEQSSTGDGIAVFGSPDYYLQQIVTDSAGRLCCTDNDSLIVLNPDLSLAFSLRFPHTVQSIVRGQGGTIWGAYRDGAAVYAMRIDSDKQEIRETIPLMNGGNPTTFHLIHQIGSGSGCSFCYADEEALWGVTETAEGELTQSKMIDLVASGIAQFHKLYELGGLYPEGLYPVAMIGADRFLAVRCDESREMGPVLFRHGEDLDPEDVTTILLAHSIALTPKMVSLIKDWNAEHPLIRIETVDYSSDTTNDDRFGGEAKICFDMLNGGFRPDIILTDAPSFKKSDRSVMTFVTQHNLYVDLAPYLEKDDKINYETLYGLVPRSFDDGQGGMWGITTGFTIQMMAANPNFLGEIAQKGTWTIDEWLDIYESIPPDVEMYHQQVRAWGVWNYIKEGYAAFIKDGVCSFDSPQFIRFLKLMAKVPKDYDTWKRTSPFADLNHQEAFRSGKAVVDNSLMFAGLNYVSYHGLIRQWNAEAKGESVLIGFATDSGIGIRTKPYDIIVITKYAQDPDLCFEVVKALNSVKYISPSGGSDPMFALRTLEEEALEKYDGTPIRDMITDEMYERVNRFFDESGEPMLEYVPEAIWEIIEEESSAYYAGHGTAEDCAKKIQSRASHWVAEHQ